MNYCPKLTAVFALFVKYNYLLCITIIYITPNQIVTCNSFIIGKATDQIKKKEYPINKNKNKKKFYTYKRTFKNINPSISKKSLRKHLSNTVEYIT